MLSLKVPACCICRPCRDDVRCPRHVPKWRKVYKNSAKSSNCCSLVPRPHPAHVRRRGLVSQVKNPWASSRSVERPIKSQSSVIIRIMRKREQVASFPGSPLTPTKNKNGGGEPGTDSHVISRHNDVTAIITKVVTQLCSHVIG